MTHANQSIDKLEKEEDSLEEVIRLFIREWLKPNN